MNNVKFSNICKRIEFILIISIPYLYIICLILLNMSFKNAVANSVKHVTIFFYLQELMYIFQGVIIGIYTTFIKKLYKIKLVTLINICILCCLIALLYINNRMFQFLYNARSAMPFFIGVNLYFLVKSINSKEESI